PRKPYDPRNGPADGEGTSSRGPASHRPNHRGGAVGMPGETPRSARSTGARAAGSAVAAGIDGRPSAGRRTARGLASCYGTRSGVGVLLNMRIMAPEERIMHRD